MGFTRRAFMTGWINPSGVADLAVLMGGGKLQY
jgi:hypothetical protein